MGAPAARAPRPPRHQAAGATHTALARRSPRPQPLPAARRRTPQHPAAQRGLDHPAVHAYRQHRCTPMHQDGPSVSAKTPGRAVAYPLDVITLASHTTADKRRTSPLPGHHQDHTAASRSSSRKLAINTRDEQYGHLTVEDDPEGTTDEAELLSRHRSQDEA
jgi:hypothetical protein